MQTDLLQNIREANYRSLARAISHVENGVADYSQLLAEQPPFPARILGITGPPGAGKSTLVDVLIGQFVSAKMKVAVLCAEIE